MLMEWKCCSCRGGDGGSAGGCALSRRALRSGRRANIAVMAVFLAVSGWEVSARPPYYEQFSRCVDNSMGLDPSRGSQLCEESPRAVFWQLLAEAVLRAGAIRKPKQLHK